MRRSREEGGDGHSKLVAQANGFAKIPLVLPAFIATRRPEFIVQTADIRNGVSLGNSETIHIDASRCWVVTAPVAIKLYQER